MKRTTAIILSLPIILNCGPATDRGEVFASYVPVSSVIAELTMVKAGMSYSDLLAVRPDVVSSPYVGASEVIRGDTVQYYLDPAPLDGNMPMPSAVLRTAVATSLFDSFSKAEAALEASVTDLAKSGMRVTCYSFDQQGMNVFQSLAEGRNLSAVMTLYPERLLKDFTGPLRVKARVTTTVGQDIPASQVPGARKAIECHRLSTISPASGLSRTAVRTTTENTR